MNAPVHPTYTNEITPQALSRLDVSPFTEAQLAEFGEQARAVIQQQREYVQAHPPLAIYRFATEGSQTRDGGVIQQATSLLAFTLDCGRKVRAAQKGDAVLYADGSTARIVTTAGQANSHLALVGSRLSNGDEIINTLQGIGLFVARQGVPMAEDFLPRIKGVEINE
ncbi:hypothetical protein [Pseudomonas putida]|uniref:hypothetical protein n=1 Tax=Pseudomonas putida TaxID=303 RepID=UPI003D98BDD4